MSRQRSPNRDKALKIYKEHSGNIKLKDIAEILNVSDIRIRKWKSKDKWYEKLKGTLPLKSNFTSEEKCTEKEPMFEEVKEVLKNPELTDKQRLFCIYYTEYFNATKAYRKSYGSSYETAMVNGSRLLRNTRIKAQIEKLKQNKLNRAMLDPDDVFHKYMDIAFASMNDYIEYGTKEITMVNKKGEVVVDKEGKPIKYSVLSVALKKKHLEFLESLKRETNN